MPNILLVLFLVLNMSIMLLPSYKETVKVKHDFNITMKTGLHGTSFT